MTLINLIIGTSSMYLANYIIYQLHIMYINLKYLLKIFINESQHKKLV